MIDYWRVVPYASSVGGTSWTETVLIDSQLPPSQHQVLLIKYFHGFRLSAVFCYHLTNMASFRNINANHHCYWSHSNILFLLCDISFNYINSLAPSSDHIEGYKKEKLKVPSLLLRFMNHSKIYWMTCYSGLCTHQACHGMLPGGYRVSVIRWWQG